jgi:signal transduction histidine kinase
MEFILVSLIKIVLVLLVILTTVANLVFAERRVSAFIQKIQGNASGNKCHLSEALHQGIKLKIQVSFEINGSNLKVVCVPVSPCSALPNFCHCAGRIAAFIALHEQLSISSHTHFTPFRKRIDC